MKSFDVAENLTRCCSVKIQVFRDVNSVRTGINVLGDSHRRFGITYPSPLNMGCYPTFRDKLSVPLADGTDKLSRNVGRYKSTVRKIPEEQNSYYIFTKAIIKDVWTAVLLLTTSFFRVFRLV
jgi:hypothetical protein